MSSQILPDLTAPGGGSPSPAPSGFLAMPAGVGMPYWGTVAPAGTLLCQGQWVSKETYAALYAAIGDQFDWLSEAAEHPGEFRLPDPAGRVIEGKTADGTLGAAIAAGLPEISGTLTAYQGQGGYLRAGAGAFGVSGQQAKVAECALSATGYTTANFSAAASDSRYGAANTVQMAAILSNYIVTTGGV